MNPNKPKINIIEINLGIEANTIKESIQPETEQKINKIVENSVKEKEAIQQIKVTLDQVKIAFNILYSKMEQTKMDPNQNFITSKELLSQTKVISLSMLVQSINRYLNKEKNNIWKLRKKIIKGETTYFLTTS